MTSGQWAKRVELSCRHVMSYAPPYPVLDDTVYCRECRDYRVVTGTIDDYRIRCVDCRLSRVYGRDHDRASRAASMHVLKYSHTVSIMDGSEVIETIAPDPGQGQLPFDTVTRNRVEQVKEHQGKLRDFLKSLPKRDIA